MLKYIFQCLTTKYFDFDGRASLAEFFSFWFFWGFIFTFFVIAVNVIDNESVKLTLTGIFLFIMALLFYPASAVTVRRLHDGDLPGWMILLVFAGCPGIILVFFFAIIGDHDCRKDNKYGPALPENTGKWNEDEDEEHRFL